MNRLFSAAALSMLLAVPASALISRVATAGSRTIGVAGEAVVYVVPDEATIRFGVETYDPLLITAAAANDTRGAELLRALRGSGIAERDIQADHADVEIIYPPNRGVDAGIAGYRMRRAYTVTIRQVDRLDDIVRLALRKGANHVEGYELRTSELRKHRDDVRKRAIRAAHEKAVVLAGELGCRVGDPISIGEGYYGWFGTRSSWGPGSVYGNQLTQNTSYSAPGPGGEEAAAAPVGQIGVRAQVQVTFDLIPREGAKG